MVVRIDRPHPGVLLLRKTRGRAATELAVLILFFALWYSTLVQAAGNTDPFTAFDATVYGLFGLFPLLAIPRGIRRFRLAWTGEEVRIDGTVRVVERNGDVVARSEDVVEVAITVIRGRDVPDEHRISLVLAGGERLWLDRSHEAEEIAGLAEEVAALLGARITRSREA